ncbi:MAG: hypothetical protein ACTSYY_01280 [Promethearchaeota archaeon]
MKIKILNILGYDLKDSFKIVKVLVGFLIIFMIPLFNLLGIYLSMIFGFGTSSTLTVILENFENFLYEINLVCFGGIIGPLFAGIYGAKSVIGYGVRVKIIYSKPINRGDLIVSKLISFLALAFIIIAASVIVYSIIYSILFGINIFHYEMDIILPTIFLPIISIISSFALAACLASIFKKQGATIAFAVIYFLFYPLMIYGIVILTIQMNLYTAMGQGNSIIWYGILVMILCCLRLDFYYTNLINGIGRFNIISMRTNGQLFSLTSMFNYNFAISIDALISLIFLICFSVVMLILSISRLSLMDVID